MLLDQIIDVPFAVTFNMQWCTNTENCNYGYPDFLLEMINKNPIKAHNDLLNWYNKYVNKLKAVPILDKSECQKKFGIDSIWGSSY